MNFKFWVPFTGWEVWVFCGILPESKIRALILEIDTGVKTHGVQFLLGDA